MWIGLLIILGIYAPYFLVITGIRRLWGNLTVPDPDAWTDEVMSFSIVIPFRNEIENLPSLVESLKWQVHPASEVVFVNDHSSDGGFEYLVSALKNQTNFYVLENNGEGKKGALTTGIHSATYNWIVSLDADIQVSEGWFNELYKKVDENDDMIILPVALTGDKTWLQKFEVFDFLALQGFTFCYARNRKPFLANGAHLAFKKSSWQEVNGYEEHQNYSSGDDIFLLQSFRQNAQLISFEWSEKLIVKTECSRSFNEFINQKVRWGSKTSRIDFKESKLLSALIVLANLSLLVLACFGLWDVLVLAAIIKTVTDINFILPILISYQRKDLIKFLPIFIFLYPFYITFVGIATLFVKPKWKGRQVK